MMEDKHYRYPKKIVTSFMTSGEDCMQRGCLGDIDIERNKIKEEVMIILVPKHSIFCPIPHGFSDIRQNVSHILYQYAWV